jgi:dolichol-phosphate mannosyltransferase
LREIDELLVNNGAILDVFVLDDNSPDGTAKIALDTQTGLKKLHVQIISGEKSGLGAACTCGLKQLIATDEYTHIIQMDADFSHPVGVLAEFVHLAEKGIQLAVGSRYVKGAAIKNWSIVRQFISKFGNSYVEIRLKNPKSGFRLADHTSGLICSALKFCAIYFQICASEVTQFKLN